jgi:arylesterase / paraoxonase
MAGLLFKVFAALLVAAGAVLYQMDFYRAIIGALALRRTIEPLAAFPYQCRRVYDERLRACEDMWLSESTRQFFLVCSDPLARNQWMPKYVNHGGTVGGG